MLDRITHIASDLESAKVKAKSLFETLSLSQNSDGLRILDQHGHEVFCLTPRTNDCLVDDFVIVCSVHIINFDP
jgi:hypothetical protein